VLLSNRLLYRIFHNIKFLWAGKFTDDKPELNLVFGEFYKYRMAEWQACIIMPQIMNISMLVKHRQALYRRFHEELNGATIFKLPPPDIENSWACIIFPILISNNKFEFYRRACDQGVDFAFSFTFIASPEYYKYEHKLADSILNIPFYKNLSESEIQKTINVLNNIDREMRR
jgi:dTDP-4-amino-4,6-dideoxygalactose transaminase